MKSEYFFNTKLGILHWKASGRFTLPELIEALSETMNHPDYRPGMKSLNDLRDVTVSFSTPEVQTVADFLKEKHPVVGEGRVALVLSHDATYGMARAFQVYAEASTLEIEIFRDIESACDWLGIEFPAGS